MQGENPNRRLVARASRPCGGCPGSHGRDALATKHIPHGSSSQNAVLLTRRWDESVLAPFLSAPFLSAARNWRWCNGGSRAARWLPKSAGKLRPFRVTKAPRGANGVSGRATSPAH